VKLLRLVVLCLLAPAGSAFAQAAAVPSQAQPGAPVLDFEFFNARVQPIFTTKRPGHARCVSCHASGTPMRLQPLPPGAGTWSDEDSRKNFDVVRLKVIPGNPDASRLLLHPLAAAAGGDPAHDGGKHWASKDDPEWRTLAAWVRGATLASAGASGPASLHPRIVQTNSAGDGIDIIDPAINKIVGRIVGIEVNHGVAAAPDGSRLYVSNESDSTLDVVDARTLFVTNHIPLSGHPNNISISRDGRRVYVAIASGPGAVDVIDTVALERVKSVPIQGRVHNTYVTPDGRFVMAGSVAAKSLTVVDQQTETPSWVLNFDHGVRPMAFETNRDGSTKRVFVQLSDLSGFAVVDFAARKEVQRIELPKLASAKPFVGESGSLSHGMAVSADNSRLVVDSSVNRALYVYSLPDLKLLGSVDVGLAPDWVTLTPDGKTAYVANAASNEVSAVDIVNLKEVARIPVGQVPKRNITAMLP